MEECVLIVWHIGMQQIVVSVITTNFLVYYNLSACKVCHPRSWSTSELLKVGVREGILT